MIWIMKPALVFSLVFLPSLVFAAGEVDEGAEQNFTPITEANNPSGTIFALEKKDQKNLLQLRGTGANRGNGGDDSRVVGLELLYGHLFHPSGKQYLGYYFLSGKLETDNRQRFNATLGYFPALIGGEAKLTYRALNAEVRDALPLGDEYALLVDNEIEEEALEQGFGFLYKKKIGFPVEELAVRYTFTHLGGERVSLGRVDVETPTAWRRVQADIGFGDVETHEVFVEIAGGVENLNNGFINSFRLDLGLGYQEAQYEGYRDTNDVTDKGYSIATTLRACTPLGIFSGGYQDSQAADTAFGAYRLGGLELYYKNIDYEYGQDEDVLGISFVFDLFDPDASFSRQCPAFFLPEERGYSGVMQMAHIGELASDEYTAKPIVRILFDDIYSVDKLGLPSNVYVDNQTNPDQPTLVISTSCRQTGVLSVNPSEASSAFTVSGSNVNVNLANLPNADQRVQAIIDDRCCGNTQISIGTTTGSTLAVNSVNVREEVGCQPQTVTTTTTETAQTEEPETATTQTQQPQPVQQCLAANTVCNASNIPCCPGTSCQFAFNTGNTAIFTCQ